jgi:predicted SnoaL-like aldol condensation-catalyzing enzyme
MMPKPDLTFSRPVLAEQLPAFFTVFGHTDQQEELRCRHEVLVAELHPAQRGRTARTRRLFDLVNSMPELHYEFGLAMASNDYVVLHGRVTGTGQPRATIVSDILRLDDGVIAEHWDVQQPEATEAEANGRRPMWGDSFPS